MIKFVIIHNKSGKVHVRRWYVSLDVTEKREIEELLFQFTATTIYGKEQNIQYIGNKKFAYKKYASLYFWFCIDEEHNDLLAIESIHAFVEHLNSIFDRVKELNFYYDFHRIYSTLDGFIDSIGT